MRRANLLDYYIERSNNSDFQIDQIRKELESKNISEEEIQIIVRLVDNEIQNKALSKVEKSKSNELVIAGAVLTIVGAGITLGTYTGLINMGNSFLIVYGPLLVGLSMIFGGFAQKRD